MPGDTGKDHEMPLVLSGADPAGSGSGAVAASIQLMAKSREARQAVCLLAAAAYIGTILLPAVLIGGCAKPEMACNVLTYPCVYAVSALGLCSRQLVFS